MGVPAQRVYIFTFAIGFALAGFGGVVAAPITTVDFRGGVDLLPVCFIAVIIGGLGNLPGTAAAAILLSLLEGIIQSVANPTVARISSLVLMSAVLCCGRKACSKGISSDEPHCHRAMGADGVRRIHAFSTVAGAAPWSTPFGSVWSPKF